MSDLKLAFVRFYFRGCHSCRLPPSTHPHAPLAICKFDTASDGNKNLFVSIMQQSVRAEGAASTNCHCWVLLSIPSAVWTPTPSKPVCQGEAKQGVRTHTHFNLWSCRVTKQEADWSIQRLLHTWKPKVICSPLDDLSAANCSIQISGCGRMWNAALEGRKDIGTQSGNFFFLFEIQLFTCNQRQCPWNRYKHFFFFLFLRFLVFPNDNSEILYKIKISASGGGKKVV